MRGNLIQRLPTSCPALRLLSYIEMQRPVELHSIHSRVDLQELLDHLEGMLSNEAVVVTVGQAIVEVKPQVSLTKKGLPELPTTACFFAAVPSNAC